MNVRSRMVLSAKLPSDQTTAEVDQLSCPFAILSIAWSLTVDCFNRMINYMSKYIADKR